MVYSKGKRTTFPDDPYSPVVDLINNFNIRANRVVQVGTKNTVLTWDLEHRVNSRSIMCFDNWMWDDSFYITDDSDIDSRDSFGGCVRLSDWSASEEIQMCRKVTAHSGHVEEFAHKVRDGIDILIIDWDKRVTRLLGVLQSLVPLVRPGGLIVGSGWDGIWSVEVKMAVRSYWTEDEFRVDKLLLVGDYLSECFWKRTNEANDHRYTALQARNYYAWGSVGDTCDT